MTRGFTLAEILTVIAIIILVSGISAAFLRTGTSDDLLDSAVRALTTDLRYASELSVTTQENHAVKFDAPGRQYFVVRLGDPEVLVKTVSLDNTLAFSQITFSESQAAFNALGAAVEAGSITLKHSGGPSATIEVRPSGYVRIE